MEREGVGDGLKVSKKRNGLNFAFLRPTTQASPQAHYLKFNLGGWRGNKE